MTEPIKRICVYCGSSPGADPAYAAAARGLGKFFAESGVGLVFGGGNNGLMGEVSRAAMEAGGETFGVITEFFAERGLSQEGLTELFVVPTMHERKAKMVSLADAFVALPGSIGTLEEFAETITWAQLGIHEKPCGLLNVNGYYDRLISFLDQMVAEKFLQKEHRKIVMVDADPRSLVEKFKKFRALPVSGAAGKDLI